MVKAFHGTFAASHDLTELGIREILIEFENEQRLSLGWKLANELEQRFLFLRTDKGCLWTIFLGLNDREIVERNFLPATAVAMPVRDEIMGNPIEPGREWDPAVCVVVYVIHRPLKNAGGQVLRIMEVPCTIIHIVEDAVDIPLIEQTEGLSVTL